jgi:hypothetical protein
MTIYLDTETGPSRRVDVAAYLASKAFDHSDLEASAKAATKALAATSLSATLCELHVVSMALDDGPVTTWVNDQTPLGEKRLIEAVAAELWDMREEQRRRFEIVAFNAGFDQNVIRVCAMRHKVRLPKDVHGVGVKPCDSAWRCAMGPLRDGWSDRVSLEKACLAFGVPLTFGEAGDIPGSEVGAAIAHGEIERVAQHCAVDVERVRAVWRHVRSLDEVPKVPPSEATIQRIVRDMGGE